MGEITYIDEHRKGAKDAGRAGAAAIHCLMISINQENLLLPNTAVAEVINYDEADTVAEAPEWLLGLVSWRDRHIPLVSFERISQSGHAYPGSGDRIVICNSLNGNRKVPYVGIVAQGIPHLQLVKESDLAAGSELSARPCVALAASFNGSDVLIPNLDDIESRIQDLQS